MYSYFSWWMIVVTSFLFVAALEIFDVVIIILINVVYDVMQQ